MSANELQQIIDLAKNNDCTYIHLGSRQDILFPKKITDTENDRVVNNLNLNGHVIQNIVCSYVSTDIFPSTVWLRGTTFLYILEAFQYRPTLKINITDPLQSLVPLFTGDLNYIASNHEDYWYLYLRLPNMEEGYYPVLIYTWDIAELSKIIENNQFKFETIQKLFDYIKDFISNNNRTIDKDLSLSYKPFPYYEGMNKMGATNYWLGLYWRNNQYNLSFLSKLANFCLENRIGKICITPFKSLIIKGIPKKAKLNLEKLLGISGINIRHSSLELNWHVPVDSKSALELKQFLVNTFDQNDISTYGLTFSVLPAKSDNRYFTSIVIEEYRPQIAIENFEVKPTYNVLYAHKFDPNSNTYTTYAQDITKVDLPLLLLELSKKYYETLGENEERTQKEVESGIFQELKVYRCKDCLNIYDPKLGEPEQDIEPNTDFDALPESFICGVCDNSKAEFESYTLSIEQEA